MFPTFITLLVICTITLLESILFNRGSTRIACSEHRKKKFQPSSVFPTLQRNFYRSLSTKNVYFQLTNYLTCFLITAFKHLLT